MTERRAHDQRSRAVLCVDFGTASSKAALATRGSGRATPGALRLLALGAACRASAPLLLPSKLLLDGDYVHFGPAAIEAAQSRTDRTALQSFKLLLGARDLERSLTQRLTRNVDPEQAFRQRDALVLYLAYLLGAARRAVASDPAGALRPDPSVRYALPGWRAGNGAHSTIARMIDEADAVEHERGDVLFGAGALSYNHARASLDRVAREKLPSRVEGSIFEGAAAAACHHANPTFDCPFSLVVDVGAGTTDFAAFHVATPGPDAQATEIVEARCTIDTAGDAVDCALMNLILDRAGSKQQGSVQGDLWRKLLPQARALKETIFDMKKGVVRVATQSVTVRLGDLVASADFKDIHTSLASAYRKTLEIVAQHAARAGENRIAVILTGGGAALPVIRKIVRAVKSPKVSTVLQPIAPLWAEQFLPVGAAALFPLVAVAMGGALADSSTLVQARVS